jgi:hypothetical protein
MTTPKETIQWPGRGEAKRLIPRGMSDYTIGIGPNNNTYQTDDGATLTQRARGWKAQYKGHTTKWKSTAEEAMADLDD